MYCKKYNLLRSNYSEVKMFDKKLINEFRCENSLRK